MLVMKIKLVVLLVSLLTLTVVMFTSCSSKTSEPRVCPMWNTKGFEQADTLVYPE
jgi:hypothetical protein